MAHVNRNTTTVPAAISQNRSIFLKDKDRNIFLKDEYLLLQNQYEDFDRRNICKSHTIIIGLWAAFLPVSRIGRKGPGRVSIDNVVAIRVSYKLPLFFPYQC